MEGADEPRTLYRIVASHFHETRGLLLGIYLIPMFDKYLNTILISLGPKAVTF